MYSTCETLTAYPWLYCPDFLSSRLQEWGGPMFSTSISWAAKSGLGHPTPPHAHPLNPQPIHRPDEAYFPLPPGQLDNPEGFLRAHLRGHLTCPEAAKQPGSLQAPRGSLGARGADGRGDFLVFRFLRQESSPKLLEKGWEGVII